MSLTTHQTEKFDEVISYLRQGHKRVKLIGSAGVGKTFLAGEIVKYLKRAYDVNTSYNNGIVFATAPTNKALAVLQSKITTSVEFKTVHSAIGLSRYVDNKTGKEVFIKAKKKQDNFKNCKIAIIDECSMLPSSIEGGWDEEDKYVPGYLDHYGFPIIYIGDDKQINPVGEPYSPVFRKDYPTVELTEIIRQGAGNPIIDLSRDIDMIHFKQPSLINGKGYTYDNHREGLIENLAEVNGTDEMKFLAFTNNTVDEMNKLVRIRRYGTPKKIEKDETIVFNSPYGDFYTNKEVKIENVETIVAPVPVPNIKTKFDSTGCPLNETDFIKMKYYRLNGAINVVHEDSEGLFNTVVNTLKYNCSKLGWGWRGKYFFEEQFADIKYNHAITVHKSQGSTYKTSIMDVADIMINRKVEERQRLLYTAITRASDLLILNNVK